MKCNVCIRIGTKVLILGLLVMEFSIFMIPPQRVTNPVVRAQT
jgi:hypothetical protein